MSARVLIIDDSRSFSLVLAKMITSVGGVVVGSATSADEGLALATLLQPDVITLDLEMPDKNGLVILPRLQKVCDAAVIMCSALTGLAASITLQCLEKGAFDYIPKTEIGRDFTLGMLKERLQHAYAFVTEKRKRVRFSSLTPMIPAESLPMISPRAVVIGVSTGGPAALQEILTLLPILPIPIIIVQHMPAAFVSSLAERINNTTHHKASLAISHLSLLGGKVYFAPGDKHIHLHQTAEKIYCYLKDEPVNMLHKPSVDVLFQTAAESLGKHLVAVVLTGMGKDGAEGAKTVRLRGGVVIAQSRESCTVYGMPKNVIESKTAQYEFNLPDIAVAISRLVLGRSVTEKLGEV